MGVLLLAGSTALGQQPNLLGYDYRLYRDGPAEKLARAVRWQNVRKIRRLTAANPALLRYQEPRYGETVLILATVRKRARAVRALLEAGADPNQQDTYDGYSPVMEAAQDYDSSALLRLLLAHGGDPNAVARPTQPGRLNGPLETPLMFAVGHRLESVKLLVEAGADVNYYTGPPLHRSVIESAFIIGKLDILRYLIIERQIDVHTPLAVTMKGDTLRIGYGLRTLVYPLDSEKYRQKMELVQYLEGKGVDYWRTPVPDHYYKIYSKEFLDKY